MLFLENKFIMGNSIGKNANLHDFDIHIYFSLTARAFHGDFDILFLAILEDLNLC
jgi:hypothetical protein